MRCISHLVLPVASGQQTSATSSEGETPFFLIVSGFSLFIWHLQEHPKTHSSPQPSPGACHEHIFTVYYQAREGSKPSRLQPLRSIVHARCATYHMPYHKGKRGATVSLRAQRRRRRGRHTYTTATRDRGTPPAAAAGRATTIEQIATNSAHHTTAHTARLRDTLPPQHPAAHRCGAHRP